MIPLPYAWSEARQYRAVVFGWRPSRRTNTVAIALFETMSQAQAYARRVGRKAIIRRCWLSLLWIVSVPVPPVPCWLRLAEVGAPASFREMLAKPV